MADFVLIHGLWVSREAWQPWIDHLAEHGHRAVAPAWPGELATAELTRRDPSGQAGVGVDEIVEHFGRILADYDTPPVVIGHSFGGLVAQRLLDGNRAAAAVAIDPAPIKGVRPLPFAQLRSAWPVLHDPRNRTRVTALTKEQWRYAFGNALEPAESDALWSRWAIPSPGRPLFQAATANLTPGAATRVNTRNGSRGPLLITGGTVDHTVPLVTAKAAHRLYGSSEAITDFREFEGRGHSLTIDGGWSDVADTVRTWLYERGVIKEG